MSHCDFNLHSSDDQKSEHIFMFIGHLQIFFCKRPVQAFCPFSIDLAGFFSWICRIFTHSGQESFDNPCFANLLQHFGLPFGFAIVFFD